MLRPREGNGEEGATIVIVAIVVVVLFGFTALAVDVGRMYEERRELQRTADVSAMSGAQLLPDGEAEAESVGQFYVSDNPSVHHPGVYNELTGDLVDAKLRSNGTGCDIDGVVYDCVESKVVAPEFDYLFADVMGFDGRSYAEGNGISAKATAVMGSGAPGGEKLVPWLVLDCPNQATYPDETPAVATAAATVNPSCPYTFSNDFDSGPRVDLFAASPSGGNFQGADLSAEPNCPQQNSYFPRSGGSGGDAYRDFLAGAATPDVIPCTIGKGARLHAKTGGMPGPTNQGLNARGVSDACMNSAAFAASVEVVGPVGGEFVRIKDHNNPCLVALLLVVQTDPNNTLVTSDVVGDVPSMQHPDPLDVTDGRFSSLRQGASKPLIVRRFAFFYITERGGPSAPYRGLFMKALDSGSASLDGPADFDSGIFVVKLTG